MFDNIEKNIAKGSLAILSGTTTSILVSVVTTPVIVRLVGLEGFGEFATVLAVYSLLYAISDIGLSDSIRKHIAEEKNNLKIRSDIASVSIIILILSGILTLMAIVLVTFFLHNYFDEKLLQNIIIICIGLVFSKVFAASRSLVLGLQKEEKIEFLQPLNVITYSIFAILLTSRGYGSTGLVIAHALGSTVIALMGLKIAKRYYNFSKENLIDGYKYYRNKLIKFGFFTLITVLLTQLLYQSDVIMIKYYMSDKDVGVYKAALLISEYLWLIPSALQMSLLHTSSELWSKNEHLKISQIASKLMKYTLFLLILLIVGLFVLTKPFIRVYYGNEFINAAQPLQILLIGSFAFGLSRLIFPILQGKGELTVVTKCTGVATLLNILLNWVLIPIYGILGAAIATSISYFSMILLHSKAIKKVGIDVYKDISKTKTSLFTIILFTSLIITDKVICIFTNNDWVQLLIIPPMGLIISIFLLRKLDIIPIFEFKEIFKLVPFKSGILEKLYNS